MKGSNKILAALLICTCATVTAGVFAACDDLAHETHDYGDWVVTAPTEESEGSAVKTCKAAGPCGQKTVTVNLPVLGDGAYAVSDESAATCTDAGQTTYTLPNGGDPISFAVEIPATGHGTLEYTPTGSPSLHKAVTEAHWSCPDCKTLFSDEEGTTEIEAVVLIPAAHPLTYVAETPATCTESGKMEHYYCEACNKSFGDEDGDKELSDLTIPALKHVLLPVEETPATCREAGEKAHYHCRVCEKNYGDQNAENELTDVAISALSHEIEKVEGQDPTCTADGFEEYWACKNCNDMFRDSEGAVPLDLIRTIPATGSHTWGAYPEYNEEESYVATKCSVCHGEKDKISVIDHSGVLNCTNVTLALGATYYTHSVNANRSASMGFANFSLPEEGIFEINFAYTDDDTYTLMAARSTFKLSGTNTKVFTSATAVDNGYKNNIKLNLDDKGRITKCVIYVDGVKINKGDTVNMAISGEVPQGETGVLLISVTQPDELNYGANTVHVTAAGATADSSKDTYTFIPAETKTYSLTVPAGVYAILSTGNEADGGRDGASVNFDATAGQPITITFLASEVGSYGVTIGEKANYIFTPDISYSGLKVPCKTQVGDVVSGGVTVLEVGDIEEGKYTVTVTLYPGNLTRGMLFFGKNIAPDYEAIYGPKDEYGMGGTAEVYWQNMSANLKEDIGYVVSGQGTTFTVTLDLREGDTLVFAHTAGTDGLIDVSMAPAQA